MKKTYKTLFAFVVIILCIVNISFAQCSLSANAIYVAPNATGSGTAANPASILNALAIYNSDNTRTPILLAGGTYNLSNTLYIPSGIDIEGSFSRNGSTWSKDPTAITNVNVSPPFQYAQVIDLGDTFTPVIHCPSAITTTISGAATTAV